MDARRGGHKLWCHDAARNDGGYHIRIFVDRQPDGIACRRLPQRHCHFPRHDRAVIFFTVFFNVR
jgi:hypothetical protein